MAALRIATRGSALALVQTRDVARRLRAAHPAVAVEERIVRSTGDRDQRSFARLPGIGFFVKELEDALLDGRADLAVHSLKDLPTVQPEGLAVAAVLEREDARDALITRDGGGLASLPQGARVATSSPRRQAQLARLRPDLRFVEVRGNVDTRLAKLEGGQFEALVLALAGLRRLGLAGRASEVLDLAVMLPAPGQGAVAVEGLTGSRASALAAALDHRETRLAVAAERAFLLALGGGCSVPVAAHARPDGAGEMVLEGLVADAGGGSARGEERGPLEQAQALGQRLAERVREAGGGAVLARVHALLPLAGKRVLVTHAAGGDDELAFRLAAAGAEVVPCPAIATAPARDEQALSAAAGRARDYDAVAFTSRRAVASFVPLAGAAALSGRSCAVGEGTARALREHGVEPALVAGESHGAGLAAAVAARFGKGARVLFPRAEEARPELALGLSSAGLEVDEVVAYRTVAADGVAARLREVRQGAPLAAVTFLSPSAVRHLLAAGGREALAGAAVACIGETTAAAAREAGLAVAAVAARPTAPDLAEAVVAVLRQEGRSEPETPPAR